MPAVGVGHWSSQNLSPNICSIVRGKTQSRTLWRAKNISIPNGERWNCGVNEISWQWHLCLKHNHPFNREHLLCLTNSEWNGWIHGRNMLKMVSIWSCFSYQPLIEGVSQKQWENEPTIVLPFDHIRYSCSWNLLHVSGITKHSYRQYLAVWQLMKPGKIRQIINCSLQITQKRN